MSDLRDELNTIDIGKTSDKLHVINDIQQAFEAGGCTIVELNTEKPWGAYLRLDNTQADVFVREFFPGLSEIEARLGNDAAELSPKILIVSPNQRLSWQYHHRRAERWAFLTEGAYNKSQADDPGEVIIAKPGDVIQFATGERHRLVGSGGVYTIVAEIWQHTETDNPSDEADIVRLADDYSR